MLFWQGTLYILPQKFLSRHFLQNASPLFQSMPHSFLLSLSNVQTFNHNFNMNLFAILTHHSISAADKVFEKTRPGCFSTSNTEAFRMLAWNGMAKVSDIFEKEDILEKSFLKQIIHEVSMNYFEAGKLVYYGAWTTLFWSKDITVSVFFEVILTWLFDVISFYLFRCKRSEVSWSIPWTLHGGRFWLCLVSLLMNH